MSVRVTTETAERTETRPPEAKKSPPVGARRVMAGIAVALGILIVVLVAAAALLPQSFWRWLVVHEVSHATGRPVNIAGKVAVHLFTLNPELTVEGLTVANPDWAKSHDMLSVKKFDATLSLKSLLRFHLIFPQVTIDSPAIDVERDSAGRANWDFTSTGKHPAKQPPSAPLHIPVIQQLKLSNGTLSALDRIRKLSFNGQVSVVETQDSADSQALKLRGSGTLNGKPFQLKLDGEPLIGVQPSKPYGFETAVTAADIKLSAHTTITHPFDLGALQVKLSLVGKRSGRRVLFDGTGLAQHTALRCFGHAGARQTALQGQRLSRQARQQRCLGKSVHRYGRERPKLTATLVSKQLNLADLAAPLGTRPRRRESRTPRGTGPARRRRTAAARPLFPMRTLQVQRVRGMDADVQFEAASVTA